MTTTMIEFEHQGAIFGDELAGASMLCAYQDAGGRGGFAVEGDRFVLLDDHGHRSLPIREVRSWSVTDRDGVFDLMIEGARRSSVRLEWRLRALVVATLTRLVGATDDAGRVS